MELHEEPAEQQVEAEDEEEREDDELWPDLTVSEDADGAEADESAPEQRERNEEAVAAREELGRVTGARPVQVLIGTQMFTGGLLRIDDPSTVRPCPRRG
ncbi:hypothetical protein [Curtobacterium poinsettiae]|uniref:hypothetical protein n=1 Tax=Curtobacterium poinsettiae TaxID=159612 RepID=UPI0021CA86D1|nr:hypothetical protein [Curtobacterium flaccumfaciens]MCU0113317.1 hypothetical protein [Curtobacterium flaccumfaciens]